MGRIQQFLTGFYEMTFKGKGAFWGIVAAVALIVLVYIFTEKIRDTMKKSAKLFFIVPVLLLAGFVFLLVNSCRYIPISDRKADDPVSYAWEQTTKSTEISLQYRSDVKDPKTGKGYAQTYAFGDIRNQLTFKETSEHVGEAFTISTADGSASITFSPDGAYRFLAKGAGAEETGTYAYVDKVLLLTGADGTETKVGKTSSKLRYASDTNYEFSVKELKDKFVIEENLEYVPEEFAVTSDDGSTVITFRPDGTYAFRALDGGAEETGQYAYRGNTLTLANAEGSDAFWKNFTPRIGWLVFAVIVALLMILTFLYNAPIKAFMNRHPLVWLIIPAALLIYFVYVAIGWNIWVSVSDWGQGEDRLNVSYGWGGFGQYAAMFKDGSFWNAVVNTLKLFLIIPICLLLGMGLALVMDQGLKGTPVFRTLILLPFALSFVVTGLIWQQMYNGNRGILVEFFKLLGINSSVNWMSNEMVMYSIMIVMIWQFSGYVAVIFLAAIKNVPPNIINAAKLDGAYMPRIYWKLIIPQLKGAMGSCITILAMYALRSFDLIYSLTSYTNPASATLPIMMYVEAFSKNNYAYAAAISCFLLALVLVLILPLTYWTNRRKR